jgi:transposase
MYVRKVKAGKSVFFQIGNKIKRKFVLIQHVGSTSSPDQIELLHQKALVECERLKEEERPTLFPLTPEREKAKLINWRITGFHQVFGLIYDRIGFPKNHLRDLAIARIAYPRSKLATARYLEQYLGISLSEDKIYRFLDTLNKDELTQIAFNFVKKKNNNSMALVFYDVTTLYFETNDEDELRKKGYSKDHKNDLPQIVIGLFVDKDGYPFDFDFYDGKTFEGHTFAEAVGALIKKYQLTNLVVVADAGMLSQQNIDFLERLKIYYIVGARLKGMSEQFKKQIFSNEFTKNPVHEIVLKSNSIKRLIIDYSEKRAQKDRYNREKIIKSLETKISSKKPLIKKSKYLLVRGVDKIEGIDHGKVSLDQRHDGLKGYWTNLETRTKPREIIDQYHNLWKVEKAFRMSKSDLLERPIYHRKKKRISGHLLLCFSSLLVMKETEKLLKEIDISLSRSVELLGKVGQGEMRLGKIIMPIESDPNPETNQVLQHILGH